MNHRYFIILLVAIVTTFQTRSVAQRFSLGLMSGVNFSHPHGDFTTGKWESRNGPVVGISFQYKLTNILSLQTELNYTSLYYKRLGYKDKTIFVSGGLSYRSFYDYSIYPYFSNINEKWDLNFFRVPLMAKLSTPTKLKFEFAGGVYWSFLNSSAYSGPYPYYLSSSMYPTAIADLYLPAYSGSVPDKDFGYLFTAGFSYPLSKSFRTSLTGRYFIGDKQFFESVKGRTGAFELNLGVVYTGFSQKGR
ncbi:MAG: outer membrane beta-barrel protein [Bacteroidales bacterium]|nr:outer membrane beta-barrel protein [Bacteroidales bacterium]